MANNLIPGQSPANYWPIDAILIYLIAISFIRMIIRHITLRLLHKSDKFIHCILEALYLH